MSMTSSNSEMISELENISLMREMYPADSYQRIQEWMSRARSVGDANLVASGMLVMGKCAQAIGNIDEWMESASQATRLAEQSNNRELQISSLIDFGSATAHMGFPGESIALFERATLLAAESVDPNLLARLKILTATPLSMLGKVEDAYRFHVDAINLATNPELILRFRLALVAFLCDDLVRPAEAKRQIELFLQFNNLSLLPPRLLAWYWCLETVINAQLNDLVAMAESERHAASLAANNLNYYAWCQRIVADTLLNLGQIDQARRRVEIILTLDLKLEKLEKTRFLLLRARIARISGYEELAIAFTSEAYAIARPTQVTQENLEAKVLTATLKGLESQLRLARSQDEIRKLRQEIATREIVLRGNNRQPRSLLAELYMLHGARFSSESVADLQALGFSLMFQPILSLDEMKIEYCEALLRLNHPTHGDMLPGEFIPTLEHSGDIIPVGIWVINEACKVLHFWRRLGLDHIKIAVNVSAVQMETGDFSGQVIDLVNKVGIPPAFITLEFTESLAIRSDDVILKEISVLRAAGFSISIDDFGVGYCNFSRLIDMEANTLKIDRSLVQKTVYENREFRVLKSVVSSCQELSMSTIAEGIETVDHAQCQRSLGCSHLQGYLIGKPMSAENLVNVLKLNSQHWVNVITRKV